MKKALVLSTVTKSLAFQAPAAWDVLVAKGYDITFAADPDVHAEHLRQWGEVTPVALSRTAPLASVRAVRDLSRMMADGVDFVQLQTPIAGAVGRVSLPSRRKTASLYVAHGLHITRDFPMHKNLAFGAVENALVGRTSAIGLVAKEDFEYAHRMGWGKRTMVWRLPGAGVNLARFEAAAGEVDRSNLPRTALFCGELNTNKGFEFCVALARDLHAAGAIDHFTIVGDGPLREVATKAAAEPWVTHLPFSPDVPELMARSHLLLHASQREGLPRVIIEAMAAGLPVLARSNRGSRELVTEEVGVVIEGAPELDAWRRAAMSLLAEWSGLASQARAVQYSEAAFVESYGALMEQIESGQMRGYVDGGM